MPIKAVGQLALVDLNDVDGVSVRNILRDSTFNDKDNSLWSAIIDETSVTYNILQPETDKPMSNIFRMVSTGIANKSDSTHIPITANKTYTISFDFKVNKLSSNTTGFLTLNTYADTTTTTTAWTLTDANLRYNKVTLANGWKRYILTFTPTAGAFLRVSLPNGTYNADGTTVTAYWREIMLQEGKLATAWTPAPEDILTIGEQVKNHFDIISDIDNRTTPENLIATVVYSKDLDSILSDKANAEDLTDMATGEQLAELRDTTVDYVDARLDGEGGINESINAVSSQLTKTSNEINAKFSAGGGINLIKNSIGYGDKDFWMVNGTVNSTQSKELEQLGIGSGWLSTLGTAGYIEQTVTTAKDDVYTLSFLMKKLNDNADVTNGSIGVEIWAGGTKLAFIGKTGGQGITTGYELGTYTFSTNLSEVTIRVTFGSAVEGIVTALMFNTGTTAYQWTSHTEEIYTTTVQMNLNGIKVIGMGGDNYVTISPIEFAGYAMVLNESDQPVMTRVFTLNNDVTEVTKLDVDKEISMQSIKVIPINTDSNKGWAFLPIS